LVSDFQQKENTFPTIKDSLFNFHLVQVNPVNTNNIALDSVYIENQNSNTAELVVSVSHKSNIENVPISLLNNGNLVSKTTVQDNDKAVFTIPVNQAFKGKLQLDDSSLQFDNQLFFSINEPEKINVLVINESEANYLYRIFNENEFNLNVVDSNQLNYNTISDQNLIILNELSSIPNALINVLNGYRENGGYLLIVPSINNELTSYNKLLVSNNIRIDSVFESERIITQINFSHPIYRDVFDSRVTNFQYPKATTSLAINNNQNNLLEFEDGSSFLSSNKNTYLFTAALNEENSNFINSPLIVPTIYNISKQSLSLPTLYYTIGDRNTYDVNTSIEQDEILRLVSNEDAIIPQQQTFNNKVRIVTYESPTNSGAYKISRVNDVLKEVSYNYNRNESYLNYFDLTEFKRDNVSDSLEKTFAKIKSDSNVKELWKWFVIFALIFLIIEMLILKYFK
jgi:hypothetical protein